VVAELFRRGLAERQAAEQKVLEARKALLEQEYALENFGINLPGALDVLRRKEAVPFTPAGGFAQSQMTVLVFTSPIPSHPHTYVLERVYNSIRRHLPDVRIIILADGVDGPEPLAYTQFKNNVKQRNWEIMEFKKKSHQTLMLRQVLLTPGFITTPLLMIGEHDWGIRPRYIDWEGIVYSLLDPACIFQLIQLRQDRIGGWEMGSKFFGDLTSAHSVCLLPTTEFQCPTHVARCDWYRKLVPFFRSPDFLEKQELENALQTTGAVKEMACYVPAGPMGRLYHLDGRNILRLEHMGGIGDS
jgi:hypothetical protein